MKYEKCGEVIAEPKELIRIAECSMSEKKKNRKQREIRRDVELLKIQFLSRRCHAVLTTNFSLAVGLLIGFGIALWTVQIENLGPTPMASTLVWGFGTIMLVVSTFAMVIMILKDYNRSVQKISEMIEIVKEGKELPRLEKLRKMKLEDLRKMKSEKP